MSLTLRSTKGSPLTYAEADANFSGLADLSLTTFLQSGTGAVATDLQTRERQIVYVTDFAANGVSGAKVDPTGVLDSTLGIQAAINAVNQASTDGGTVYFPPGTYKVSATITQDSKIGVVLKGAGVRATVIAPTTALSGLPIFKWTSCRTCVWEQMWIKGNASAPPACAIELTTKPAPTVAPTQNCVRDCLIGSAEASSITKGIKWTSGGNDNSNDISVIERVEFVTFITAALSIEHSNSLNHRIVNCALNSTTAGSVAVLLAGGSFTMMGCQLSVGDATSWDFNFQAGTYRYPIYIIGTSSEAVSGILKTSASNVWIFMQGYYRQGATSLATIFDCASVSGYVFISNSAFNLGQTNIWSFSGASSYVSIVNSILNPTTITWEKDLVMLGNKSLTGTITLTPGASAALYEVGTSDTEMAVGYVRGTQRMFQMATAASAPEITLSAIRTQIANRFQMAKGADVASATTITLGAGGNLFSITGTTQIDNITATNWQAGSIIILEFTASLTVSHNVSASGAVIWLSGGANFSATANDQLFLEYNGTQWREVARTVI